MAKFSLSARLLSFRYAINGLRFMLRSQHNAWIHLAITICVFLAAWRAEFDATEWRWVIVAVALVWTAETMNTAIEFVCDVVSPEYHALVEKAKDIAAGAVLICAIAAAVIGCLTFWPYIAPG